MVQSLFAPHTSNTSGEAAKSLRHIFTPAGHSMGLFWQGIIDHITIFTAVIQWNLRRKDALGTELLSFLRRLSLSRRFMKYFNFI